MSTILVVTGSVRPNSINKTVVGFVREDLAARDDVTVQIADLGELQLPFFDGAMPPSADGFVIENDAVQRWSELVSEADGIVFVAPEYNHSLSAVQKNAIDWLFEEWKDKPVAFVGYGWYAGANALAQFKEISTVIKWKLGETVTELQFSKDINPDGSYADESSVKESLHATLDELVAAA